MHAKFSQLQSQIILKIYFKQGVIINSIKSENKIRITLKEYQQQIIKYRHSSFISLRIQMAFDILKCESSNRV